MLTIVAAAVLIAVLFAVVARSNRSGRKRGGTDTSWSTPASVPADYGNDGHDSGSSSDGGGSDGGGGDGGGSSCGGGGCGGGGGSS